MRRLLDTARSLWPGFALAVFVLVVGDVLRLAPQWPRFINDFVDGAALAGMLLALYLLSGLVALAAISVIAVALVDGDPREALGHWRRRLVGLIRNNDREPQRGARLLAALLCIPTGLLLSDRVILHFVSQYNTEQLVALASTACLLLLLPALWLTWRVVTALLVRGARLSGMARLIHARSAVVIVLTATLSGAVFAVWIERDLFKEIDGYQLYLALLAPLVGLALVLLAPATLGSRLLPRRRSIQVTLLAASLLLLTLGLGLAPLDGSARALLLGHSRTAAPIAALWQKLFDFDGDGVSSFLAGGDCAPFDRWIYPGAVDIPDNGVDEDCFDGDLKAPPPLATPPALTHPGIGVQRPDVVLLSIDGCRRDALEAYGAPAGHSPELQRFAKSAVVLNDAISPSSWTMPSFAAILTSRFASELKGYYGAVRATPIPADVPLLTEPFKKAGYRTVAVTAGLQLDKMGMARGFGDWRNLTRNPRGNFAQAVADAGIEYLRSTPDDKPLLLWLHAVDAHYPYEAPAEHRLFGNNRRGGYAAEIHYVDQAFGSFLRALDESPRGARSVVVLFADHGEAFKEHGIEFHGASTYAEEVRTPFIFRVPGVVPRREKKLVGLIDLAPTLWDLAGLTAPGPVRGHSLALLLVEKKSIERGPVFSEQTRYTRDFALTTSRYRLRYDQSHNYVELFDRSIDPEEQRNLASELPHIARSLRRQLQRVMAPIAYMAGKRLASTLLHAVPPDHDIVSIDFVKGPRLAALRLTRRDKQLDVSLVFAARGPLAGKRFEIELRLQDDNGARLAGKREELTAGAYLPGRWRWGDWVRHRSSMSLKTEVDKARLCLSLLIDKKRLLDRSGQSQACVEVNLHGPATPAP